MKTTLINLVALLAIFLPSAALACSNCYAASSQRTIMAYYASTLLLSLMPFVLICGVILAAFLMRQPRDKG